MVGIDLQSFQSVLSNQWPITIGLFVTWSDLVS